MKRILYTLLVAALCAAAYSCSSSKGTGKPSLTDKAEQAVEVADLAPALVDKGNWQTMKIPVNVALKKPVSAKLGGTMTLVRGKEIRLSMRFFGMEVAAASITGDSVKAYVKMQKIYVAESLEQLLGGFPATVDNVQSLLLARIFEVGRDTPDFRRCKLIAENDRYTVTPPSAAGGLGYTFTADMAGNILSQLEISHSGGHKAKVGYAYPRNLLAKIPDEVSVWGSLKGKALEARIDYSVDGIDRSASAPKPFSIPGGYRKISSSSLLKLLDSLK